MTLDPNLTPHPIPPAALEWDAGLQRYVEVESPACRARLTVKDRTFTCDKLPGHDHNHRHVVDRDAPAKVMTWCGSPYNCAEPCWNVELQLRLLDQ